jgi:hypothetical protein
MEGRVRREATLGQRPRGRGASGVCGLVGRLAPPRLCNMAHLHDYDDEREHGRAASIIGCLSSWRRWIGRPDSARSKRPRCRFALASAILPVSAALIAHR